MTDHPEVITPALLRLCSTPLRCIRCGQWYEQVQLRPSEIGETWAHCPRCERELLATPAWAESLPGVVVHAALLLGACAAIGMVLP